MICKICNIEKLSREYPSFTLTDECEHPPLHCLRCVTAYWELHKKCSFCDHYIDEASLNIRKCYGLLETLFPEIPCVVDEASTTEPGQAGGSWNLTVIRLNGEAVEINYNTSLSICRVKEIVEANMNVAPNKQRLVYKGHELKEFKQNNSLATVSTYGVTPGSVIHLMVLLYAIPSNLNKVVFDLDWGFPSSGLDYLDASALIFSGTTYLEVADYKQAPCYKHTQDIACGAIDHSGDILDELNMRGHHKINVSLHSLPSDVTHIFFTLSAWASPTISHYKTPTLKFYEKSNPTKMLCTDQTQKAGHRQAIVMCSLCKSDGHWFVHGNGKLSDGNTRFYEPLKETIRELITTMGM